MNRNSETAEELVLIYFPVVNPRFALSFAGEIPMCMRPFFQLRVLMKSREISYSSNLR